MSALTLSKQPGRSVECKSRPITRTMTSATAIARLPQGSRILGFVLSGVASNAVTTATISIGSTTAANEYVNGYDVKTAATGNGVNLLNGVAGAVGQIPVGPNGSEQMIYVKYAETGGASSAGAWTVHIIYTTGEYNR